MFRSGLPLELFPLTRTLVNLNDEMNDIMKIVKYFEEFDLLIKDVSKTIENEAKEQKVGFLSMLLGTSKVLVY